MDSPPRIRRRLGTMVAFGFSGLPYSGDLALARRMGAAVVEILPDWEASPDPVACRRETVDAGLEIHSAHGSWGRRSITGARVDLGSLDETERHASVEDLKRCHDWLAEAGGRRLVVHPGVLSGPEQTAKRADALARSLLELAEHAAGGGVTVCVENMPPGVHPGSRMQDLARLVAGLGRTELALVLDTGHARLSSSPEGETLAAGALLRSLHVHDNDGRADQHLPPGRGAVRWPRWLAALDEVAYEGPILLECIRQIRQDPAVLSRRFLTLLADLTGDPLVALARDAAPA